MTTSGQKAGKCMLHNWAEERAVAALDTEGTKTQIQRRGHRGILSIDLESKVESLTTNRAVYVPPKGPGVRLRGVRGELMEKHITQMISEAADAQSNRLTNRSEFCSTTQTDFSAGGFVPPDPEKAQPSARDYLTDQAITFWSENVQHVQGVSGPRITKARFGKSSLFSTPIGDRLDDIELLPSHNRASED